MFQSDTIAAIATAMSNAGIGIIRISGPDAIAVADAVFRGKRRLSEMESHSISYGYIVDPDVKDPLTSKPRRMDEVLVSVFRAPRTYTREDVVEINCHGGILMLQEILRLIFKKGARPAEAGEFTKRAFLNGRIDLAQAEAVMDLIRAENDLSARNSLEQLSGALSYRIREMRQKLLYEIAFIEAALDDPEHYDLDGYATELKGKLEDLSAGLEELLASSREGAYLKEGIVTAIVGRPNAGKSSLLNALAGRDRAIVTDIPGTTRDTLEEKVRLGHVTLNLVDTAGIRESDDQIEQIGVQRAFSSMREADLILCVMDASRPMDREDRDLLRELPSSTDLGHCIILLNKMDLDPVLTREEVREVLPEMAEDRILSASALREEGLDLLSDRIEKMFFRGQIQENGQVFITNARHKYALDQARASLRLVIDGIDRQMTEDLLTVDLMNCYEALGKITGETLEDDLADEIFSKFCMGK